MTISSLSTCPLIENYVAVTAWSQSLTPYLPCLRSNKNNINGWIGLFRKLIIHLNSHGLAGNPVSLTSWTKEDLQWSWACCHLSVSVSSARMSKEAWQLLTQDSSCKGLLGIARIPRGGWDGKIHLLTVTTVSPSSYYTKDMFIKNMHSSMCTWLLGQTS